jgi:predicted dehydrogenase
MPLLSSLLSRRTFLSVTSAGAVVPHAYGPNDCIGVGIIGLGQQGCRHVSLLNELSRRGARVAVVALCDVQAPRLHAAAQRVGRVRTYRNHRDLLADRAVDVVAVATPDRLHLPQSLEALRAGKDVMCESPWCHWAEFPHVERLVAVATGRHRILRVGDLGPPGPLWSRVAELIGQGVIGRPRHGLAGVSNQAEEGPIGEGSPAVGWSRSPACRELEPGQDQGAPCRADTQVTFCPGRKSNWRRSLQFSGGPAAEGLWRALAPLAATLNLPPPAAATATGGILENPAPPGDVPDTLNVSLEFPGTLSVTIVSASPNHPPIPPSIQGDEGRLTLVDHSWTEGCREIVVSGRDGTTWRFHGRRTSSPAAGWLRFLDDVRLRRNQPADLDRARVVQAAVSMGLLSYVHRKVARSSPQTGSIFLS